MTARGILTAAAVGLLLAGCVTAKKPVPVVEPTPAPPPPVVVVKPAPPTQISPPPPPVKQRACVPKTFPRAPKYPDTDAALRDAGGAADRYQLMAAGRVLRSLRLTELEKIVEGCR
ncbi:MAG: hypothetical protein ACREE0_17165 [Phenylobacterium sp.]